MIKIIILFFVILLIYKRVEHFDAINNQLKPFGYYLENKGIYQKNINDKDKAEIMLNDILS
jgi:hypothetical protein